MTAARTPIPRLDRGRPFVVHWVRWACVCGLLVLGGCIRQPRAESSGAASLTVDDILGRCVAGYQGLTTFQAKGLMRDYRRKARLATTISWSFSPPDRCRLQIGMDVALITGAGWQEYDAEEGRYRSFRHFTRTPIQTAAYLLSKGVPFLLPEVIATGSRAFGKSRVRGFADWTLESVQWLAEHPCYVLRRPAWGQGKGQVLRVWIDQDRFLIRGWALIVPGQDGQDRTLQGCTYYDLFADEPLAPDVFEPGIPKPILLSQPNGAGG